jgi:hypothetical protein
MDLGLGTAMIPDGTPRAERGSPAAQRDQDGTASAEFVGGDWGQVERLLAILARDPALRRVVEVWPTLPGPIRAAVKAMIDASLSRG